MFLCSWFPLVYCQVTEMVTERRREKGRVDKQPRLQDLLSIPNVGERRPCQTVEYVISKTIDRSQWLAFRYIELIVAMMP